MTTASPVLAAELQAYINYGLFGPVPVYWNDLSNERGQHRTREITPRLAALVFSTSVNCSTSTRLLKPKSQVLFLILFVLSLPESQLATRSAGSTSKIYPKCIHSVPLYCQCPTPATTSLALSLVYPLLLWTSVIHAWQQQGHLLKSQIRSHHTAA